MEEWNNEGIRYQLRAKRSGPPAERKANAKIHNMNSFFQTLLPGREFEPDYRLATIWADEGKFVKWDASADAFVWFDDVLQKGGYVVHRNETAAHEAES